LGLASGINFQTTHNMQKSTILKRCTVVISTVLLITNLVLCCSLLFNTASKAQDSVEPLTSNAACGKCMDLAYEGDTSAFSFSNCKEGLKRFEITRDNGETEFVYASEIPAITNDETLESIRKYNDLDSIAFQRGYLEEWFDFPNKVEYKQYAIIMVVIFSLCACFGFVGCLGYVGYFYSIEEEEAGSSWAGMGSSAIMGVNFFIWMTTVFCVADVETIQPTMFGETECLVIEIGYPFHRTMLVFNFILSFLCVWIWGLNMLGCVLKDKDGVQVLWVSICQLIALFMMSILWVALTIAGFMILGTIDYKASSMNLLIGLGVACGAVCWWVVVPAMFLRGEGDSSDESIQIGHSLP